MSRNKTPEGRPVVLGPNITDTYLVESGLRLFTVGVITGMRSWAGCPADEVAVVAGAACECAVGQLRPDSQGLPQEPQLSGTLDCPGVVILVPIFLTLALFASRRPSFPCPSCTLSSREAYNYNTRFDDNPRNLILLATTQGGGVTDNRAKLLYHHQRMRKVASTSLARGREICACRGWPARETVAERRTH